MGDAREQERIGYRAPLALHCFDAVSTADTGDGLRAVAWRDGDPARTFTARPSPVSSLLGFGDLPVPSRYRRVRSTGGRPLDWPPPPVAEPFVVRVSDRDRRYLPAFLLVDVPAGAPVDVPLYSAPNRPAPSGWAIVRGELRDSAGAGPVAWGVVEVSTETSRYVTVSDAAGRFLLYLPYPEALPPLHDPEPRPAPLDGPAAGSGLGAVTWPLTVAVRSQPAALRRPATAAGSEPPYLDSILGQAAARIDRGGQPQPSVTETLAFGAALVLPLTVVPA